jgi:hypothetical protein
VQKNGKRFTNFFSVNRFPNLHNPPLFSFSLAQTQPPFFSHRQPSPLSSLSHRNLTPLSALARTDPIPSLGLLAQIPPLSPCAHSTRIPNEPQARARISDEAWRDEARTKLGEARRSFARRCAAR